MKYVPKGLTRFAGRSSLKLQAKSPTLLVVGGVVGLGVTAVMAARATRGLQPIIDEHKKQRVELGFLPKGVKATRVEQRAVLNLYVDTAGKLTRLYGPSIAVGTASAASVLIGHNILNKRHLATVAAYTGLMEQFQAYRGRVAKTLGPEKEVEIYNGAHGEWVEDPNHKGEHKMEMQYEGVPDHYLRPWFDEMSVECTNNPSSNYLFLKGMQGHFNNTLSTRGHVFLNEVLDALGLARVPQGQVAGWMYEDQGSGDGYIDFGFMHSEDPRTQAFVQGRHNTVQLNFNIDPGMIHTLI